MYAYTHEHIVALFFSYFIEVYIPIYDTRGSNDIAPVSSAGIVLLLFRTNANALSTGIYAILMRCQ